jgi:hypothetical protein
MRKLTPKWMNLLNAATATNSAPTAATDGVKLPPDAIGKGMVLRLRHSATGARTATVKLWGYCPGEFTRGPEGLPLQRGPTDIASTAGWDDLGEEKSLSSVSSDGSITAFVLEYASVYERLYVELTAVSGTSATISVAAALLDGAVPGGQ